MVTKLRLYKQTEDDTDPKLQYQDEDGLWQDVPIYVEDDAKWIEYNRFYFRGFEA